MANRKKSQEYLIAYFDILGYKTLVANQKAQEHELIIAIEEMIRNVMFAKHLYGPKKAMVFCFSDNFLICIKLKSADEIIALLGKLVFMLQLIQIKFIQEYNIFLRGSIVKGLAYARDRFIYGKGLIQAYTIENEIAVFPRIIVESSLVHEYIGLLEDFADCIGVEEPEINERNMFGVAQRMLFYDDKENERYSEAKTVCLKRDFDNEYYIDVLPELLRDTQNREILSIDLKRGLEEGETKFQCSLFLLCYRIVNALSENAENHRVLEKYLWYCSYVNQFCYALGIEQPFSYDSIQFKTKINLKNAQYQGLANRLVMF